MLAVSDLIERLKTIIPDSRYLSDIEDGVKDSDEWLYIKQIGDYTISESPIETCGMRVESRYKLVAKTYCKNKPEVLKTIAGIIMMVSEGKPMTVSLDSEAIYNQETGLTLGQEADFLKITFTNVEYIDLNCIGDLCGNCC